VHLAQKGTFAADTAACLPLLGNPLSVCAEATCAAWCDVVGVRLNATDAARIQSAPASLLQMWPDTVGSSRALKLL
jgi:hypothetical protein